MDIGLVTAQIEQGVSDLAKELRMVRDRLRESEARCAELAAGLAVAKAQLASRQNDIEFIADFDLGD